MQLQISPESSDYASDDLRWQQQVNQLLIDLNQAAGGIQLVQQPATVGAKGGADVIILALGSSGAIAAAVSIFKAWLNRSGDRSIVIVKSWGGETSEIRITASNIDSDSFSKLIDKIEGPERGKPKATQE